MDVREKLVELLERAFESFIDDPYCIPDEREFADHLIAHGVTVQEWISVKDRLPDQNIRVLVWMQDNEEEYTQIDTDRWSCTMEQGYHWIRWGNRVTHWMPLPQPPKGE